MIRLINYFVLKSHVTITASQRFYVMLSFMSNEMKSIEPSLNVTDIIYKTSLSPCLFAIIHLNLFESISWSQWAFSLSLPTNLCHVRATLWCDVDPGVPKVASRTEGKSKGRWRKLETANWVSSFLLSPTSLRIWTVAYLWRHCEISPKW